MNNITTKQTLERDMVSLIDLDAEVTREVGGRKTEYYFYNGHYKYFESKRDNIESADATDNSFTAGDIENCLEIYRAARQAVKYLVYNGLDLGDEIKAEITLIDDILTELEQGHHCPYRSKVDYYAERTENVKNQKLIIK